VNVVTLPKEMTINMLSQELDPAILQLCTRTVYFTFKYKYQYKYRKSLVLK